MQVRDAIQEMINELVEAIPDAEKFDSGNKAAGTRIRKLMQSCKVRAHELRKQILDKKR